MPTLADHARAIFAAALAAAAVRAAVHRHLHADAQTLTLANISTPLSQLDELLIIALGKAAAPMYQAAAQAIGKTLPHKALIVSPSSHPNTPQATYLQGSHPTPTGDSLKAAEAVLTLLHTATPRTAVLFLISGGASAMVEQSLLRPSHDLSDIHRALVASGVSITQMNTLRKHISSVKGGRLALAAAASAVQCTLLLSDVPSGQLSTIGSGPSLPDTSTLADCRNILNTLPPRAKLRTLLDPLLLSGLTPETPKPGHPAFARSHSAVILSSDHLAHAAQQAAESLGFHTAINNACDELDYSAAADFLLAQSSALARQHPRSCLISVGELSVTLSAHPGQGGRNQQFALYAATQLARRQQQATILSAGSDGIDGNSPAAGALADATTAQRATALGLNPAAALAAFNTYPLFHALGDNITTGPTGNNLRDLRLILTA
jgi:glycerate 2-kinase